jgi:hypothetical protein
MIHYKTDAIKAEWEHLHPIVRGLLLTVAAWQYAKWSVPITVTCIVRDSEENKRVGGLPQSAHVLTPGQIWARAVDIRNNDLTIDQRRERRDFILTHWNWKVLPPMIHVVDHNSGAGDHTHINLNLAYKM